MIYQDKAENSNVILTVIAISIFMAFAYLLSDLIKPFILALFFSYAISPLVNWLEDIGLSTTFAIIISLLIVFSFLAIIAYFFYFNISTLELEFDKYYSEAKSVILYLQKALEKYGIAELDSIINQDLIKNSIFEGKDYLFGIFKSTGNFASQFLLFLLYMAFILPGLKNIAIKVNRSFNKERAKKINKINERIFKQIQQYLITKGLVSFLTGLATYILCLIFGLELAIVWGVLAFLFNFIPTIGSIIGAVFPILFSILTLDSTFDIILFSSLIVSFQFSLGNILEPMLMSNSMSLSPLVVFTSLIFWSWFWGITGAFLSIPIMAVISIIFQNIQSTRPISYFLQSSFPINEDKFKLSLIWHIVYSDGHLHDHEKDFIDELLQEEIYNKKTIKRLWKKIQKKPIPLDEIFYHFEDDEKSKLHLYKLAVKLVLLDKIVHDEEKVILKSIQSEYAQLSKISVINIHKIFSLNNKFDKYKNLEIDPNLNNYNLEQDALSYQILAEEYLEHKMLNKAKKSYLKAQENYFYNKNLAESKVCSEKVENIDSLLKSSIN